MKTNTANFGINRRVMTMATIFVVITSLTFGQTSNTDRLWLKNLNGRIFQKTETNDLFQNVNYIEISEQGSAPVISRTIHTSSVEVIYEEGMKVENWMTAPFEYELEKSVDVESWMTVPFEYTLEESIKLESWMTAPFETALEESVYVESWMTAPFETALEESVYVENWMTAPFETALEKSINIENWMTQPMAWLN